MLMRPIHLSTELIQAPRRSRMHVGGSPQSRMPEDIQHLKESVLRIMIEAKKRSEGRRGRVRLVPFEGAASKIENVVLRDKKGGLAEKHSLSYAEFIAKELEGKHRINSSEGPIEKMWRVQKKERWERDKSTMLKEKIPPRVPHKPQSCLPLLAPWSGQF